MTLGSNNDFPSVLLTEGTTPATPAASHFRLFVRSSDHVLCTVNSAGTVAPYTPGGFANPLTTTGDIIYSSSGTTAARLAVGTANQVLHGGASVPAYSAVVEGDLSTSDITTANASTSKHGFAPKYPNDATKYLDGTGAYTVPAGTGGGASLLAVHVYAPASQTILSTTSTTFADVDATNAAITFTAPASGNVLVRVNAFADDSGAAEYFWGLRESSTDIVGTVGRILRSAEQHWHAYTAYVSGISGGSHTYKLSHAITGGFTGRLILQDGTVATNKWGPLIMEVWAAP